MPVTATAAVALAGVLDAAVAEPPESVHPVALFGRAVAPLDRTWTHPHVVGATTALALPLGAAVVAGGAVVLATRLHPWVGVGLAGLVVFSTISLRRLRQEALDVVAASDDDLPTARQRLPALVGRETAGLSAGEARSAAVESAAENLADGLVAPLVAFALGALVALPIAAGAAAWVKAVNTLDSMLGYRDKPVGRASARLDDLVMVLPARVAAALLGIAALAPAAPVRARQWARRPSSPNAGWPMATLAVALGVRLHKRCGYDLVPSEQLPDAERARAGVRVVTRAGAIAFGLGAVIAWF